MRPNIVESELVVRAQKGDSEAAHEIFAAIRRPITGFVHRMIGPQEILEDVVQDVLCKVFRALNRFDPTRGVRFSTWILTFARNHCIDLMKKKHLPTFSMSAVREEGRVLDIEDEGTVRPDRALESVEIRARVDSALGAIPTPHRDVFVLRQLGLDYPEIASRLGVAPGTVKSRLYRARAALREKLRDLQPVGPAAA